MGCGEVRDLCFGVLFFDQGTYFIAFVGMFFFLGTGMSEYTASKAQKNFFREVARKKVPSQL